MTLLPHGLIHATRNTETTRVDMKMLVWLHESLNAADFRPVRPWFYANILQVDVSSVQRSLQHLELLRYVERGDKCGNGNFSYRLTIPSDGDGSPPTPMVSAA